MLRIAGQVHAVQGNPLTNQELQSFIASIAPPASTNDIGGDFFGEAGDIDDADAVVEDGLLVLAGVGGGVAFPMFEGGFEVADGLGLLLRVKAEFPINLWPNAVQAYHRWIRTSIKENKRYDRFGA
jgi:hypothetical protein